VSESRAALPVGQCWPACSVPWLLELRRLCLPACVMYGKVLCAAASCRLIPGIGIQGAAAVRAMRLLLPLRSITMLPAMRVGAGSQPATRIAAAQP
jgi:hypothetical protein